MGDGEQTMQVIRDVASWKNIRSTLRGTLGFVPTMGSLHEGHGVLLKKSVEENEHTLLSIFVNPTQFNEQSDFKHYPRNEESDFEFAKSLGVDFVFAPSVEEVYPDKQQFKIKTTHPLSQIMEGKFRPGHFEGMLTVVAKLLVLANSTRAYFGEKDYQQLRLVEELCKAFFLDTEIVSCATHRLPSGLPFSSRNARLSPDEMLLAERFAEVFHNGDSEDEIREKIEALGLPFDYILPYGDRLLAAVHVGKVRLIDNRLGGTKNDTVS